MRSLSRFFFLVLFSFSLALPLLLPLPTEAGLIPCGLSKDDTTTADIDESKPCTICHIIVGGKGIMDWGLKIMTFVAVAVIVAMAIYYIVSSGNEGMMTTAKSGIKAALVGFAVMLSAWLIVSTTLRILGATVPGLTVSSSGFGFSCDTTSSAGTSSLTGATTTTPNGKCGPAEGNTYGSFAAIPESKRCVSGSIATIVSETGPITWTCSSSTATCSARKSGS